jgi:excinuclease ABC subunit A
MTRNSKVHTESIAESILLRGVRQNNLQDIDLDLPLGKLTVICGVSGSGKSSLALDTLYAEGQRRYIESFSAYARQFLDRIEKPKFDSISNLPPAIAVTREQQSRNNRSTVGTASEILEYLRVVFAKHAELRCYTCDRPIAAHSPKSISDQLLEFLGKRAMVGFELRWSNKLELSEQLFELQLSGFVRIVTNGKTLHLGEQDRSSWVQQFQASGKAITIVDRLGLSADSASTDRLEQSLATAFEFSNPSQAIVMIERKSDEILEKQVLSQETLEVDGAAYQAMRFSAELRCESCQIDYPISEPRLFNFNNPIGACATCGGFGETVDLDMDKIVPNKSLSLRQGAIAPWQTPAYAHELEELLALANDYELPVDVPVSKLKAKHWKLVQEGVRGRDFGGLNGFFAWLERHKYKLHVRAFLARWRTYSRCANCDGARLNPGALAYRFRGRTFADLCELDIDQLRSELSSHLRFDPELRTPDARTKEMSTSTLKVAQTGESYRAGEPEHQVNSRLDYLQAVGLGYVTLARSMHTLSSGEAQRVMLTTMLGSSLVDMLYVFDEPTVGLHPQDTERIAEAILGLRDRGNTVVLVEHEPNMIRMADQIVEIGPGAGDHGGRVTFQGTESELRKSDCLTSQYLFGSRKSDRVFRSPGERWIQLTGARGRNLKNVHLNIPLGCFSVVVGPSGSGKSTLVLDTLCLAIATDLNDNTEIPLSFESIQGLEHISGFVAIDQSPIQRSSRSCPATYTKAMDEIRSIYAETADAKGLRLSASAFSFNSEVGRCPNCEGLGYTTVNMQFMADLQLVCADCNGKRFKSQSLEVRFRDLTIAECLELSVEKAIAFFRGHSDVQERLQPLMELGLGYLALGRNLSTLSAGEAMRLKLASHLQDETIKRSKGRLIVMDEPTTGLHFHDVDRLVHCIDRLIDAGNTVLVIEHNEQLISCADFLIEMGPGSGPNGGEIIASGNLEAIVSNAYSMTGPYLKLRRFTPPST